MFPKFLKVASNIVFKDKVWINETHFTEKVSLTDLDQTILDIFADTLGFSYEIVLAPPEEIGHRLQNGTWTGVLGMLQRREIDMSLCGIIIDEETNNEFRLIYPNIVYETTFVTKKHEPEPAQEFFLHPFSIQVWFAIIACVFLMPFLFQNLLRRKHSIISLLNSTLGSLVGQGLGIPPKRSRDYFALASWILGSGLLYYFYAAVLLSCLTVPSLHGIRTIDDLANRLKDGTYECSTYPDNYPIPHYFSQSENPTVKVIVNGLHHHKNGDFVDYIETYADSKKPAFVAVRQDLTYYKDFYFISQENFFAVTSTYAVRKDFCCGSALGKVVHHGWASGIFQKTYNDITHYFFRKNIELYGKLWNNPSAEGKLTLTQLKGLFIFLIASHLLAFLVFLIEVCTERFEILECFTNLNLKGKKSFSLTAVPSNAVLGSKSKISGRQGL